MRRLVLVGCVIAVAGGVALAATATGRAPVVRTATVTRVVGADTLDVRLAGGRRQRVHVLGVSAPSAGSCYSRQATASTRGLAQGKRVTLVGAGSNVSVRVAGKDLGSLLLAAGAAQIDVWSRPSSQFVRYVPVEQTAQSTAAGIWGACAADLSVTLRVSPNPVTPGGRLTYIVAVKNGGPLDAPSTSLELRPPATAPFVSADSANGACSTKSWLGSCSFSGIPAGTTVTADFVVTAPTDGSSTISSRATAAFQGCIRQACGALPLQDSDTSNNAAAVLATIAAAESPGGPAPPAPAAVCDTYHYPTVCIPPPPPILHCADIPYRQFAVPRNVTNPDPHGFDGNEDGVGCQFDDY